MSNGTGDIYIKAGSVSLDYDESVYRQQPGDPRQHVSSTMKITQIRITDFTGAFNYDTGQHPEGLRCSIEVYCS